MSQFYVNDITKQIIKNTIPKIKVVLLIISSLPLSFLQFYSYSLFLLPTGIPNKFFIFPVILRN